MNMRNGESGLGFDAGENIYLNVISILAILSESYVSVARMYSSLISSFIGNLYWKLSCCL